MVEAAGSIPRILADDILIISHGTNPDQTFKEAFTATHRYLTDLGARIAPDKSITSASTPQHRRTLKNTSGPSSTPK